MTSQHAPHRHTPVSGKARCFLLFTLLLLLTAVAHGQTYTVIHTFNFFDGAVPLSGITIDGAGNLYGTTRDGGYFGNNCQVFNQNGCGTVFKLSQHNGAWVLQSLYVFHFVDDGAYPTAGVTLGSDSRVYGTAAFGGTGLDNGGMVYSLTPGPTPSRSAVAPWTQMRLHEFTGNDDGGPVPSAVIFDSAGNLYGTTVWGGEEGSGVAYELTPTSNGWVQTVLYNFQGTSDGRFPHGVVADATAEHLFGVTEVRGNSGCESVGCGTIFELTQTASFWTQRTLYYFTDGADGALPISPPIIDASGNLYGTSPGGYASSGSVWKLTPSNGEWTFSVLHTFNGLPNRGPYGGVTMDASGNLYGTTNNDGLYGKGNVFKLSPSNGGWVYTDLYDFTGGSDGETPTGSVALDANGNLYGTASLGGGPYGGAGVVWEITP